MSQSREIGRFASVRVVANEEQFNRWWPEFEASIGSLPFVGLNCKVNAPQSLQRLAAQQTEGGAADAAGGERWMDCEGDFCGPAELLQTRNQNARRGAVALVQLSTFSGCVLLVRTCFFRRLPEPLEQFLQRSSVAKVGQGLERDVKMLRQSFQVTPNAIVDVRNVCALWPWFARSYDFDRFGVRSIATHLFGGHFEDVSALTRSPFYVQRRLEMCQIRACADEVQLPLDIVVFVLLRLHGWRLARDWLTNERFGQLLYLWTAPLFERAFLDSKLRASVLTSIVPAAAKRHLGRHSASRLRACSNGDGWQLASVWAWPLPHDAPHLERRVVRSAGDGLPCHGEPCVVVNTARLAPAVERAVLLTGSFAGRSYRLRVRVRCVEPGGGADGSGDPLDVHSLFVLEAADAPPVQRYFEGVRDAASRKIEFIRIQREWNQLERATCRSSGAFDNDWDNVMQLVRQSEKTWRESAAPPVASPVDDSQRAPAVEADSEREDVDEAAAVEFDADEDAMLMNRVLGSHRVCGTDPTVGIRFTPVVWDALPVSPLSATKTARDRHSGGYFLHGLGGRFMLRSTEMNSKQVAALQQIQLGRGGKPVEQLARTFTRMTSPQRGIPNGRRFSSNVGQRAPTAMHATRARGGRAVPMPMAPRPNAPTWNLAGRGSAFGSHAGRRSFTFSRAGTSAVWAPSRPTTFHGGSF